MRLNAMVSLGILGALAWAGPACAAESYANCSGFVTKLPATITTPGTWCLKSDLSTTATSGNGININANDVVVDCNNFQIKGPAGATSTSNGIYALAHLRDTVRHCDVQGFRYGVDFDSTAGGSNIVEDNHFQNNTAIGIRVQGDGSVIRGNQVLHTGGSTNATNPQGINSTGEVTISDNVVSVVTATGGNAIGIETNQNTGGSVDHNSVRQLITTGAGTAFAIYNLNSGAMTITDNDLLGTPAQSSTAVRCPSGQGLAARNLMAGFLSGISGCVDSGSNQLGP